VYMCLFQGKPRKATLVGQTGKGKSTATNEVLRFTEPSRSQYLAEYKQHANEDLEVVQFLMSKRPLDDTDNSDKEAKLQEFRDLVKYPSSLSDTEKTKLAVAVKKEKKSLERLRQIATERVDKPVDYYR
jgi:hypothetical protein